MPIRTNDVLTCGITNIPLTYPAKLFFILDNKKDILDMAYTVLESMNIIFERSDINATDKVLIKSVGEVHPKFIKQIFRNYRQLRPKLDSNYRYIFWEIDTKDQYTMDYVLGLYRFLKLPLYVHESMMGYHFLSVKPVLKEKYAWAVKQLRQTNEKYPPITLRIKPNKYVGEENIFFNGWIIAETYHDDTNRLKTLIEKQDFIKLGEKYQIVWYSFDHKQEFVQ